MWDSPCPRSIDAELDFSTQTERRATIFVASAIVLQIITFFMSRLGATPPQPIAIGTLKEFPYEPKQHSIPYDRH
jgi:hypothetical protein